MQKEVAAGEERHLVVFAIQRWRTKEKGNENEKLSRKARREQVGD